ncbi:phospholipase D/nuclease, partial [Caulochytrium protostelioides]
MASVLRKAKAGIARAGHTIAGEVTELDWRIRDALHIGVQEEIDAAYLAATHRFGSFAPQRSHNRIKYYVDGKDYMAAVAEAIDNAKEVVFIMGWWVTPELHLRRPAAQYPQYRLDRLLKRKAEQGVHICVLVYKEVELALTINSEHTKTRLEALHPNIVVQRHPDHDGATGGTLFWAHHEKICLIDNTIAFMGGLDLCFGRWDTHDHSVVEFPYNSPEACWPGQDYSNPRIKDFVNVEQYNFVSVVNTARMPWHDVSMAIFGPSVLDLSRHYCERWNLLKKSK